MHAPAKQLVVGIVRAREEARVCVDSAAAADAWKGELARRGDESPVDPSNSQYGAKEDDESANQCTEPRPDSPSNSLAPTQLARNHFDDLTVRQICGELDCAVFRHLDH